MVDSTVDYKDDQMLKRVLSKLSHLTMVYFFQNILSWEYKVQIMIF